MGEVYGTYAWNKEKQKAEKQVSSPGKSFHHWEGWEGEGLGALHFYNKCIEQKILGVRKKTRGLMHLERREFDRKYVHFKS